MKTTNDIKQYEIFLATNLKNYLLCHSTEKLKEIYSDDNNYMDFLNSIVVLSLIDYGFFLLDQDIIDKIRKILVVRIDEDKYKDGQNLDCINSIIRMCNAIDSMRKEEKNQQVEQYIEAQSDVRCLNINSIQEMMHIIIYDSVVLNAILNDDLDSIDEYGYFLCSLMYLIDYFPAVFTSDKYKNRIMKKLESIKKQKRFFNKNLKKYIKAFNDKANFIYTKKEE